MSLPELPELFCITNRLDQIATRLRPWDHVPAKGSVPESAFLSKIAFDAYAKSGDTKHVFYYAVEPLNPSMRPGKQNPPVSLHGLIADYDVKGGKHITEAEVQSVTKSLPEHLLPTFAHATFSGGARLVWLFDRPVACELEVVRTAFLDMASKRLTLQNLLPGWDKPAFHAYQTTYDVGTRDWSRIGAPLPASLLEQWLIEASLLLKPGSIKTDGVEIPIDEVSKKVFEVFPNRWVGEFDIGRRGVVFFDPVSVNPTAAIVTATGVLCFGQAKCHYSWADIFGKAWVEGFVQDKLGDVTKDIWSDGKNYWYADLRGVMLPHNRETAVLHLRAMGLSAEKASGLSEVEKALQHINQAKWVDTVAPLVFDTRSVVDVQGKRTLNTSRIKVMQPSDDDGVWGPEGNFPWLSKLLDSAFEPTVGDNPTDQLDHFLAWFAHFYKGALSGTQSKGHALFLCGPAETAKSFLSNIIVGSAVGGGFPASDFIQGRTEFNKGLSESGLWLMDDSSPAEGNDADARKFASRLKSLVVNGTFVVRALYRDGVDVSMAGRRIILTVNNDPHSMRMLPTLDGSIADKVMMLLAKRPEVDFSRDYSKNEAKVLSELPCFLRWLLDHETPKRVVEHRGRLFCKPYIHESLRLGSSVANGVTDLLQVIDVYFRSITDPLSSSGSEALIGTAADLLGKLNQCDATRALANKETVRSVGRKLGLLASTHSDRVSKELGHNAQGATSTWSVLPPA